LRKISNHQKTVAGNSYCWQRLICLDDRADEVARISDRRETENEKRGKKSERNIHMMLAPDKESGLMSTRQDRHYLIRESRVMARSRLSNQIDPMTRIC
jgi:hypothetical protein